MHHWIKAVGAGKRRARDLTRDEAEQAMRLIVAGEAAPEQIGAFLLALRMKGESADEMTGFAAALQRDARRIVLDHTVDIDCHADGHAGLFSVLPVVALALVAAGWRVLLRGDSRNPLAKHGLNETLRGLGLIGDFVNDASRAQTQLSQYGVGYLDLAAHAPALEQLVRLRPLLGVRTVAQTLAKLVSPFGSSHTALGVFHMPYLQSTAAALAQICPDTVGFCLQATGGLPEPRGKLLRYCDRNLVAHSISLTEIAGEAVASPASEVAGDAWLFNQQAISGWSPAVAQASRVTAVYLSLLHNLDLAAASARAEALFRSGDVEVRAKELVQLGRTGHTSNIIHG